MKLRKLFFSILAGLGIFGFTSCDLIIGSIIDSYSSDVEYVRILDSNVVYESRAFTLEAKKTKTVKLDIQFKKHIQYDDYYNENSYYNGYDSCKITVVSDNPEIAKASWDEKKFYCNISTGKASGDTSLTVEALKEGKTTLTIKADNDSNLIAKLVVTVNPEKTITLDKHSLELIKGKSEQLTYTNNTGYNTLYWSSSAPSVVSVNSTGKVTANEKYIGSVTTARITVKTSNGLKSDYCDVTVIDPSKWTFNIKNKIDTLKVDDVYDFDCDVYTGGRSTEVTWKILQGSDYATIDPKTGVLTAKAPGTVYIQLYLNEYPSVTDTCLVLINKKDIPANQFFWGTWIRMDNGKAYNVEETYVSYSGKQYKIISSTETNLEVESIGTFTKDSESVINWFDNINNINIPFFRQGGTNLKYKLRVVGFEDELTEITQSIRAAGTETVPNGKKGLKVKSQSDKYQSYTDEEITDDNGEVVLSAPVQGDTETITISDGDDVLVVVPGLKVENDGANLGTVPIVRKEDYALKVTGVIDESKKTNGYLYGKRSYPITLTITNISEKESEPARIEITANSGLSMQLVSPDPTKFNLSSIPVSAMDSGKSKTIDLIVCYDSEIDDYIDVDINVRVKNQWTDRVWVDYVPLRFFSENIPITISASSIEENDKARLNGFLIYPDGNSQFFSVDNDTSKTVYVPSFGNSKLYKLVFSGATVTGELSKSTEMLYTVALNDTVAKPIDFGDENATKFGENGIRFGNDHEKDCYHLSGDFEAHLEKGDIDFYSFTLNY